MKIEVHFRRKDWRHIREYFKDLEELGAICRVKEDNEEFFVIQLFGNIYVKPGTGREPPKGYYCEFEPSTNTCKCEFDELIDDLVKKMARGERLI